MPTLLSRQDASPANGEQALESIQRDTLEQDVRELGQRIRSQIGEQDARYIRRIVAITRYLEVAGRGMLFLGVFPVFWIAGTLCLAMAKIIENMEIGHNVMHGQYDWMNDPALRGKNYEFDAVATSDHWRHTHNHLHHKYTNIRGVDEDIGILRLSADQPWRAYHLLQPGLALGSALFAQWAVAVQRLQLVPWLKGEKPASEVWAATRPVIRKARRQILKDYILFPLIAGPAWLPVMLGNLAANGIRNIWSWVIIFCGHCTDNAEVFDASVLQSDSRSNRYRRQILGSSNIEGGKLFHLFSGHLGYHIEHHLYPDIPACRYPEMAPDVRAICDKHGIRYNSARLRKQFGQVLRRILRYSLP